MGMFALVCPDWRASSLVLDVASSEVAYANWRCLQLLSRQGFMRVDQGHFRFTSAYMSGHFAETLKTALANGIEATTLIGNDLLMGTKYSVTIRNPQGFVREVLEQNSMVSGSVVILEFAVSNMVPEHSALAALSRDFSLTRPEMELVERLMSDMSQGEAAAICGALRLDARQCLHGILSKMRCKGPAELVKLVMSLCPLEFAADAIASADSEL